MSNRSSQSLAPVYFDQLYRTEADPWRFTSSDYEARKYRQTLAALPALRYQAALEIGCSIGVFTRLLARRCHNLLALDVSPYALVQARERCADQPHVRFLRCQIPQEFPHEESFDLMVLSEVGYYLNQTDLTRLQQRMLRHLRPGGHVVLVHWTEPTDYPLSGDAVHEAFLAMPTLLRHIEGQRRPCYRLNVLEYTPAMPDL